PSNRVGRTLVFNSRGPKQEQPFIVSLRLRESLKRVEKSGERQLWDASFGGCSGPNHAVRLLAPTPVVAQSEEPAASAPTIGFTLRRYALALHSHAGVARRAQKVRLRRRESCTMLTAGACVIGALMRRRCEGVHHSPAYGRKNSPDTVMRT